MKRELYQNLSGNEVYYTNSSILLVKNMLCSKLHCQKGFDLILFLYKIAQTDRAWFGDEQAGVRQSCVRQSGIRQSGVRFGDE